MNFARLGVIAQEGGGGAGAVAAGLFAMLIYLAIMEGLFALMWWKLFEKAGKPNWASLVPIYNVIVLLEIAGKPLWWIVLMLIPCVNLIVALFVAIDVAKAFGKGTGFGVGLWLLGIIFYPILGFGDAKYIGPVKA